MRRINFCKDCHYLYIKEGPKFSCHDEHVSSLDEFRKLDPPDHCVYKLEHLVIDNLDDSQLIEEWKEFFKFRNDAWDYIRQKQEDQVISGFEYNGVKLQNIDTLIDDFEQLIAENGFPITINTSDGEKTIENDEEFRLLKNEIKTQIKDITDEYNYLWTEIANSEKIEELKRIMDQAK